MTLHFTPGDTNGTAACVAQARWRQHHVIVYGLGNCLVIYTVSKGTPGLQSVALGTDIEAVAINADTGRIAVSQDELVLVFCPENEYMSVPSWVQASTTAMCSKVRFLAWAAAESELAVGLDTCAALYYLDPAEVDPQNVCRWQKRHPAPVLGLSIAPDGSKLATWHSEGLGNFVRVWLRAAYGEQLAFDLLYASHPPGHVVLAARWRNADATPAEDALPLLSMAHIKNIRSFIPSLVSAPSEVLYTETKAPSGRYLHVWATHDVNGHTELRQCASYELSRKGYMFHVVLDPCLWPRLFPSGTDGLTAADDVLLIFEKNQVSAARLQNVSTCRPLDISLTELGSWPMLSLCLPSYSLVDLTPTEAMLQNSPGDYFKSLLPIVAGCAGADAASLLIMIHDRMKHSLRSVAVVSNLAQPTEKQAGLVLPLLDFSLATKLQGHSRSVRRLFSSSSSQKNNIILSISNFADHNYIWEPLLLGGPRRPKAITKRFLLDVTRDPDGPQETQGIASAILLNDIQPPVEFKRHHAAVVAEKGGFLSIWDCDGQTMDDKAVTLVQRDRIMAPDHVTTAPTAFFRSNLEPGLDLIIAIFEVDTIAAWVVETRSQSLVITCTPVFCDSLPGDHNGQVKFSTVDNFYERDISTIDADGILRCFSASFDSDTKHVSWTQTFKIHTNVKEAKSIHGASLIGKIAIANAEGTVLTIWDSKTGVLEFEETYPSEYGPVRDLDWTFAEGNAILLVGFAKFVLLYTQLRYDYTNKVATFTVLKRIDISRYSEFDIGDSIWLDDLYLVILAGNQFLIDDKWIQLGQEATSNPIDSTLRQLLVGYKTKSTNYTLADLARILNGPLPVYHPQFLIQAILMDQVKLVERVLVTLLENMRSSDDLSWNLDLEFEDFSQQVPSDHERFSTTLAELLVSKLTTESLPLLTRHQQSTLVNFIGIFDKLRAHKAALDANGLKFMLSLELFWLSPKQKKLSMRDINWAVHSDQKAMLFGLVESHYEKLTWDVVRDLGLVYWADEHRLKSLVEAVARTEFANTRDPTGRVLVLYLAIKKKQILLGLWRTVTHAEKDKVSKFLANDFSEPRWQSAALKNAFVLLGKHRYYDAAYFFLLAGKVTDCCLILCSKVQDFALALAVARVNGDRGAMIRIIEQYAVPDAVANGDRWLTSWIFWQIREKEVLVQALVEAPVAVVKRNADRFSERFAEDLEKTAIDVRSRSFLRDDPVLGVLYQGLRSLKLAYMQGAKAVLPQAESDFVVRLATIYSRMGCDYLSILLLQNWKFVPPEVKTSTEKFSQMAASLGSSAGMDFGTKAKSVAPPAFEEPDMSAFSFGF